MNCLGMTQRARWWIQEALRIPVLVSSQHDGYSKILVYGIDIFASGT
jgi:hypothetical protein